MNFVRVMLFVKLKQLLINMNKLELKTYPQDFSCLMVSFKWSHLRSYFCGSSSSGEDDSRFITFLARSFFRMRRQHNLNNSWTLYTLLYFPHTVFHTFATMLIRRICLTIKSFVSCDHFLYSHDLTVRLRDDVVRRN